MQGTRTHSLALATLLAAISPLPSSAQTQPVGVVTTLTGQATVARTALREPLILRFRDNVFERDRISTAEKSIVRVLLGGKAIVTVRELSVLTITEAAGRATINLSSGKIAVAVAKQRMQPGESLEVRTPNAIAAVRGTVFVVETHQVGSSQAPGGAAASSYATSVDVKPPPKPQAPPDIVQVTAGGRTIDVPGGSGIDAIGNTLGQLRAWNPTQLVAGLTTPTGAGGPGPDAALEQATSRSMEQTVLLASTVSAFPRTPSLGGAPLSPLMLQAPLTSLSDQSGPICPGAPGCPPSAADTTPSVADTTPPPGNGGGSGTGGNGDTPPPPKAGATEKIANGGFESGLQGWTLTGAGGTTAGLASISASGLGSISPPEGSRMGIVHTGIGAVSIVPIDSANLFTQVSRLTQTFPVTAGQTLVFKLLWNFLSNEFPTQATVFNDTFRVRIVDPFGVSTTLVEETRNSSFTNATVSPGSAATTDLTSNFTIFQGNGVTGFKGQDQIKQWASSGTGEAQLIFEVFDRLDTAFDSAALFDVASLATDPPLYFLGPGDALTRTGPGPLLRLTDTPMAFDSLMTVCCGGRASLAGPLLHATNSDLALPFSLLTVLQGGTLTTSFADPLVVLEGGTHRFGSAGVPMLDLSGLNTTADFETGLTLGADRPLQHAGPLLETLGAAVTAHQAVRLDTALLEATAPLLSLRGGSQFLSATDVLALSHQAKVTSLGSSLVRLDSSTLTVAAGAALNLAGGSVLRVSGDLFNLSNGSALQLLKGPLVSLSGRSILTVTGALVAFGGTGGNAVSVANSLCPCNTIGGIPVSLTGGAVASNVSIAGAVKNAALGSITVTPSSALIRVDGAGTKLTIQGL